MKWTLVGLFLLLCISPALAQNIVVPDCKANYDQFINGWTDANNVDFNASIVDTNALLSYSAICESACGKGPIVELNGISYRELAIQCNDLSKNLVFLTLIDDKATHTAIVQRDENSLSYALSDGNNSLIKERYISKAKSLVDFALFQICGVNKTCEFIFDTKLSSLSLDDLRTAKDALSEAIDSYYRAKDENGVVATYVLFEAVRELYTDKLLEKNVLSGNDLAWQAAADMVNFIIVILPWLAGGLLLTFALSKVFPDLRSETLEKIERGMRNKKPRKELMKPKDFLILVTALWIGGTIGFTIFGEVHSQNLEVLASNNMHVIHEHVNSDIAGFLMLMARVQTNFWFLMLLTTVTSLVWLYISATGLTRPSWVIELFSYAIFIMAVGYLFLGLGWGKQFFTFGLFILVLAVDIVFMRVGLFITRKKFIESESGLIHQQNCRNVPKIKNAKEKMISEQELYKFYEKLCDHCFDKKSFRN